MIALLLAAVLIGLLLPIQAGANAQLRGSVGDPIATALVSFLVGTVALAALVVVLRIPVPIGVAWQRAPWHYWIGGLLGAIYIAGAVVLAPRLGAATLIAAVVAGQMVASVILDHYGWVGFAPHPITFPRLLGILLVIAGVVLVRK